MKIKILKLVLRTEIGTLTDFRPNEIVSLDDKVAEKLITEGKAEIEI